MQATASLYTRISGKPYVKVEFSKQGKPIVPEGYSSAYYLRLSEDGKRKWESFKTLDAALTRQHNLTRARAGIVLLPEPKVEVTTLAERLTIEDAAAAYLVEQAARIQGWRNGSKGGLSPATVEVIKNAMDTFKAACTDCGAVEISEFKNPERGREILLHVRDWMERHTQRRKGKAAYTDGKKFTFIASFLAEHGIKMSRDKKAKWSGDPGLLKWHEVPRPIRPKVADVVFYTPDDLKAMWDGAGKVIPTKKGAHRASWTAEDIRDVMAVLALTGMRDEEVQHLQWDDIIWANGDGLPKFKVKDKPTYDWKPKNGERVVQPVEYFAIALRDRLKARKARKKVSNDTALLFPTTLGTPDQNFSDQIRKAIDNALKAGHQFNRTEAHQHNIVHNFRRTFATVLNSCYGLSAPTVQERIGDADLTTVQRYLGKVDDPSTMRKGFERLPFAPKK